jgi:hypothetical protein
MENGICKEYRKWLYRGYNNDWIEDIRMIFWSLEHEEM